MVKITTKSSMAPLQNLFSKKHGHKTKGRRNSH